MKKIDLDSPPTPRLATSVEELNPRVRRFIEAVAALCVKRDQDETFTADRSAKRKQSQSRE
jgi:hypothetical protein